MYSFYLLFSTDSITVAPLKASTICMAFSRQPEHAEWCCNLYLTRR